METPWVSFTIFCWVWFCCTSKILRMKRHGQEKGGSLLTQTHNVNKCSGSSEGSLQFLNLSLNEWGHIKPRNYRTGHSVFYLAALLCRALAGFSVMVKSVIQQRGCSVIWVSNSTSLSFCFLIYRINS